MSSLKKSNTNICCCRQSENPSKTAANAGGSNLKGNVTGNSKDNGTNRSPNVCVPVEEADKNTPFHVHVPVLQLSKGIHLNDSTNTDVPLKEFTAKRNTTPSPKNNNICKCKSSCNLCTQNKSSKKKKFCKYIQPEVPKNYKPKQSYAAPQVKVDDKTVYRNSYVPATPEKSQQFKPSHNLRTLEGKVSGNTTHNLSYQEYKDVQPTIPILPCRHNLLGSGPMQDLTTHKHDYVSKVADKRKSCRPPAQPVATDAPFSNKTTSRTSYMPVDLHKAKVEPFRPTNEFQQFTGKVDCNTIHRLSFMPWKPEKPVDKPWAEKPKYQKPVLCMSDDTCYKKSFTPNTGDLRPKSFKPESAYKPTTVKMASGTIYQKSYTPCAIEKTESFRPPKSSVPLGEGKMSNQTVHRASFQPYTNAQAAVPIIPCRRKYTDDAPMQDITTHKHDFVPKPLEKLESFKPVSEIENAQEPLSDKTVNRLSYIPHNLKDAKVDPVHMFDAIPKPTGKFDGNTVHKLSFMPWAPTDPVAKPWSERANYVIPKLRMDGNTVNSLSYGLPGTYVECSEDDPNRIPCPGSEICVETGPELKPCCSECCFRGKLVKYK